LVSEGAIMRLLLLLTVLVSCTSLAYGRGKKKMYGNYKTFYLPENYHAVCSEENAEDVEPVQTDFKKLESFICSHNVEDMMSSEVCICFQDSDSSWVKRCGDCNVQVKIHYKPEGYEPATSSGTGSNSGSAAALEDEATLKAIEETDDPTSIQESEASNDPSGEDDNEIPNKTKKANKAKVKAIKKKTVKTKAPKKKAAIKKPSIKALSKRKAKKKKDVYKSKKKRRFSNKKAEDTSNDIPNRPDVGEIKDSWNDIPNSFQLEEASADTEAPNKRKHHRRMKKRRNNKRHYNQEDLFAADEIFDLYAEE